MKTGKAKIVP